MSRAKRLEPTQTPYLTLSLLANLGPTDKGELLEHIARMPAVVGSANPKASYHVLHSLVSRGLVTVKVWVTPEGAEELRALGWEPEREPA